MIPIVFLFLGYSLFAQTFSSGLILETGAQLTKTNKEIRTTTYSFETEKNVQYCFGVFYSMKWKIANNYKIEFRPGITYDELFLAPQAGLYLRYYFGQNYYCAAGLLAEMHGGGGNGFTVTQFPTSASLAFGKEMLKDFWLVLSANKALDEYLGTEHQSSPGYFHNINIGHHLFWTFKLGLEFTF